MILTWVPLDLSSPAESQKECNNLICICYIYWQTNYFVTRCKTVIDCLKQLLSHLRVSIQSSPQNLNKVLQTSPIMKQGKAKKGCLLVSYYSGVSSNPNKVISTETLAVRFEKLGICVLCYLPPSIFSKHSNIQL